MLTGWPGGGAVVLLFGSWYVASQRFGGPGKGRPLLWAAVRSLLNENTQGGSMRRDRSAAACLDCFQLPVHPFYLLCPFVWQSGWAGTCRGGADLIEVCLQQGAPFKATGGAGPGEMVFGRSPLDCHL